MDKIKYPTYGAAFVINLIGTKSTNMSPSQLQGGGGEGGGVVGLIAEVYYSWWYQQQTVYLAVCRVSIHQGEQE